MILGYTAESIRAAEEPLLKAGVPLMRHAALALAHTAMQEIRARGQRVSGSVTLSLVGGGNNGGDALWAAVELARRGVQAWAALCAPRVHEEGLAAARSAGVRIVRVVGEGSGATPPESRGLPEGSPTSQLPTIDRDALLVAARRAGVWLDGLAGIGLRGSLRDPLREIVLTLNAERESSPDEPVVIAVDTPSGLSGDGVEVVLPAHVTVIMGAAKAVLLTPAAHDLVGRIDVVELGLPLNPARASVARWTAADTTDSVAWPRWDDHKYTRGVVGIAAGTGRYPGAGRLACEGALACGVGMVRYLGELDAMPLTVPEVVTEPGRVQALVLGPGGAGLDLGLRAVPVVLDAGAVLRRARSYHPAGVILTPHAGELAALLGCDRAEVEADPIRCASLAAVECRAVVMLKGAVTVVASHDGDPVITVDAGTAWLATAGTGDVLAGVTGALLAARQARAEADGVRLVPRELAEVAASAAWVHGEASRVLGGPLRASDLPRAVTRVLSALAP